MASRKGGQSALRFARLAEERRNVWVQQIAEEALRHFKAGGPSAACDTVVIAGSRELRERLAASRLLPQLAQPVLVSADPVATEQEVRLACAAALR